jgi:hypothetical protein
VHIVGAVVLSWIAMTILHVQHAGGFYAIVGHAVVDGQDGCNDSSQSSPYQSFYRLHPE